MHALSIYKRGGMLHLIYQWNNTSPTLLTTHTDVHWKDTQHRPTPTISPTLPLLFVI